jgi:inosine-uridine nucleoside N-ribohydrolase
MPDLAYRSLIVDTDMGLDDVRAIFALLGDSTADLRAVITVEGSAAVGKATDNLIGLLEAVHSESVPVLMGNENPELDSPPWRQTANDLGGATFPPPREITAVKATAAGLTDLIQRSDGIEYLALGPLGNLHMLEHGNPEGLLLIRTIWIPAHIKGNRILGWNLHFDLRASNAVFQSAGRVTIIEMSRARERDALAFLSSLRGDSESVRWVNHLLSGIDGHSSHLMLYDELAAAAVLNQGLLRFDDQAYSVSMSDQHEFQLAPNPNGNVRVARLADLDAALATLKSLWERGLVRGRAQYLEDAIPARDLLKVFHGHLGPYVVIGYRMGRLALDELHSEGHFGISAEVHSLLEPPRSCLIDGVQIGSGCTLGKRNIRVNQCDEPAWAVFESSHGEQVTIRLRPEIPALIQDLVNRKGVETAGHAVFDMDVESLFTVDDNRGR